MFFNNWKIYFLVFAETLYERTCRSDGWSVGWLVTPYISRTKHIQKEMEIRAEPPWPGGVHRPFFFALKIDLETFFFF